MIDVISHSVLDRLAAGFDPPCVTITMPTHRAGRDVLQDPIRFKNLLGQAERRLVDEGMRASDAAAVLAAARDLVDDRRFWSHQERGLVVYAHPSGTQAFRLPCSVNAHVTVGDRPDIEPLRAFLDDEMDAYWVLAISGHGVRLVRANRFAAAEVAVPDAPGSYEDANRYVRRDPQVRAKSTGHAGTGRVTSSFHGAGGHEHDVDEDLHRYLRMVDAAVRPVIADSPAPVVLAGVGSTLSEFRRVSGLRDLVDGQLEGNPDHLGVDELRAGTLPLVEPQLQ